MVLLSLALRVIPSFPLVFAGGTVNFQEGDAWYHVRTIHNLLAHFPWRSGLDPYALYPGGQAVPTAPLWDYAVALTAWVAGFGSPSPGLIDAIAAWLPALLGGALPVPLFFLTRRLFNERAAIFAAFWAAIGNSGFLWLTHLGLPDHHAAEGTLAVLVLVWMAFALDSAGARFRWLSGVALGLYLATRSAGIFVPAILAATVLVVPEAAVPTLAAVAVAAVLFLPANGVQWSSYTWLSLAVTAGVAASVWALHRWTARRQWPLSVRRALPLGAVAVTLALLVAIEPELWHSLWFEIRRVAGMTESSRVVGTVQEMQPAYLVGTSRGFVSLYQTLGFVWMAAVPALLWCMAEAFRKRRPALRLLSIWSAVMFVAAILEIRMVLYFFPVAAVLAGVTSAWLTSFGGLRMRRLLAAVAAVLVVAANLPWSLSSMVTDRGVPRDWSAALHWLRDHSPEPLPETDWYAYYPASGPAPRASYGVAMWWDYGYALEQVAHRIPMSNGTQAGAEDMARLFTETIPEAGVRWLRQTGARYVMVDSNTPFFLGGNESRFPQQVKMLGRNLGAYVQLLVQRTDQGARPIAVYLPTYYQTMGARLYLNDGKAVTGDGPWIFETVPTPTNNGGTVELIVSGHHYTDEADAARYLMQHPRGRFTVGCMDPGRSCVPVPAVDGLQLVYSSDPRPIVKGRAVRAVKIFEVVPGS